MKQKVLSLTGLLSLLALVSFGSCWPYQFGQLATDWYRGMAIPTINGYYFIQTKSMSLVADCHPKSQYIFAWEDGFYIWGIYGGNSFSQCTNVTCPTPYNNPFERIVFVSAEKGINVTKFLIDSVRWDSSGFGFFNFDRTSEVVHEAGVLLPPKLKLPSIILRDSYNYVLEIPLPKNGYYSDPEINPASLIEGIAILIKYSNTRPTNLAVSEFKLLEAIPLDLSAVSGNIEVNVSIPVVQKGTPYLAYTLIINDGSDRPIEAKPTLPFTSPVVKATQSPVTRTLEGDFVKLSQTEESLDVKSIVSPITGVRAFKNSSYVILEFSISDSSNIGAVEILRSYDLVNWEKISYVNERSQNDFSIKDNLDFESELGVFYEIQLKDPETGNEIYSVRTRARGY